MVAICVRNLNSKSFFFLAGISEMFDTERAKESTAYASFAGGLHMMLFFVKDSWILFYLSLGKGDTSVRFYELTDQEGFCHYLSEFRCASPQKGVAFMPRRGVDVSKAELLKIYRLTRDSVQPASLVVSPSFFTLNCVKWFCVVEPHGPTQSSMHNATQLISS